MALGRVTQWAHATITKVVRRTNESLDIPAIRRRYGATRGRVTEIRVGTRYRNWITLADGGLALVGKPRYTGSHGDRTWNGDGLLEFRDYATVADLIRGKILRRNANTGRDYWAEFTPTDAFFYGYIRVYGDKASNEALRFIIDVWPQIAGTLRRDLRI